MAAAAAKPPVKPPPAGKGIVLPGVEVFAAGVWQGDVYTIADLDDIVDNFHALYPTVEPPAKIGHDDEQEFSGMPAVGWVVDLWREGPKLFADVEQVFPDVADLIEAGAYKKVSAEIYPKDRPPEGVRAEGYVLKAIAFLGGELPHLKHLAQLPKPVRFAEKVRRRRLHLPPQLVMMRPAFGLRTRVFFEATPMDRKALEAQLKSIGWTDEMIAALSGVSDKDLSAFVLLALAQAAGGGGGGSGGTPPTPGQADVVWPDGMDRNAVIAELVAMGEDQAQLEAMPDADLLALYQQQLATMTEPPAPPAPAPAPTPNPAPAPQPAPTPRPAPGPGRPSPKRVTYSFAEQLRLVRVEAARAARQETARAAAATLRAGVHTFCEQMVKENKLTPAQVEVGRDGKPIGKTLLLLLGLSAVRNFAEPDRPSPLELAMEEIRSRPPLRRYGEQLPDPIKRGRFAEIAEGVKKRVAERAGKGRTLEQRLGMLPPRGTV